MVHALLSGHLGGDTTHVEDTREALSYGVHVDHIYEVHSGQNRWRDLGRAGGGRGQPGNAMGHAQNPVTHAPDTSLTLTGHQYEQVSPGTRLKASEAFNSRILYIALATIRILNHNHGLTVSLRRITTQTLLF
jgi:hypothetical protein